MYKCNSPKEGPFAGRKCFLVSQGGSSRESGTQISSDVDGLEHVISKSGPAKSQIEKRNKLWLLECFAKLKFKKKDMNK